jgi:MoxR-like ATPase
MLTTPDRRTLLATMRAQLDAAALLELRGRVDAVLASAALINYVQALLAATRAHAQIRVGLSPRAGLALLRASRAWAALSGRDYCVPEDVQAVFVAVCAHRLVLAPDAGHTHQHLAAQLLAGVGVD